VSDKARCILGDCEVEVAIALVALVVATAGCSGNATTGSSAPQVSTTPGEVVPAGGENGHARGAEVKAVIDDWFSDGTFDQPQSCAAVRVARQQLTMAKRDLSAVAAQMEGFRRRACG
jgi:hypothetical protein